MSEPPGKKEEELNKLSELISYLGYEEVASQLGVTSSYLRNLFYYRKRGRKTFKLLEKQDCLSKVDEIYDYYMSASRQGRITIDFLHDLGLSYSEIAVLFGCSNYTAFQKLKISKIWSKQYLDKVNALVNKDVEEQVKGFENEIKNFDFLKWSEGFLLLSKVIQDARAFCVEYLDFTMRGKSLEIKKVMKNLLQDIFNASLFTAKQLNISVYVSYKYFEGIVIDFFSQSGLSVLVKAFKSMSRNYLNGKINTSLKSQKILNINQEIYFSDKKNYLREFYKIIIYFEHVLLTWEEFLNIMKRHHGSLKQNSNFSISVSVENIREVVPILCRVNR